MKKGEQVLGVTVALLVFACISALLRLYSRTCITKRFGPDDALLVLAAVSFVMMGCLVVLSIQAGFSQHLSEVSMDRAAEATKFYWISRLLYIISNLFVKNGLTVSLLRCSGQQSHTWALRTIMILTTIVSISYFFWISLQCQPVSYSWNQIVEPSRGYCYASEYVVIANYVHIALLAAFSWVLVAITTVMLKKAELKGLVKVMLGLLILGGVIASVSSTMQLTFSHFFKDSADPLYDMADLIIWMVTEVGISIALAAALGSPFFLSLHVTKNREPMSADDSEGQESRWGIDRASFRQSRLSGWPRSWAKDEGRWRRRDRGSQSVVTGARRESTESTDGIVWDKTRPSGRSTADISVAGPDPGRQSISMGKIERTVDIHVYVDSLEKMEHAESV